MRTVGDGGSRTLLDTSLGWKRLGRLLFCHSSKSVREQSEILLFAAGLSVEYTLLFLVFVPRVQSADGILGGIVHAIALVSLLGALYVHQFLIFRNYSLHHSLSDGRARPLELLICLFFGVLTGEAGYLLILAVTAFPELLANGSVVASVIVLFLGMIFVFTAIKCIESLELSRPLLWRCSIGLGGAASVAAISYFALSADLSMQQSGESIYWCFAKEPLHFDSTQGSADRSGSVAAIETIGWFLHALGTLLKAVFAVGAVILSVLVLLWDFFSGVGFQNSALILAAEDGKKISTRYTDTKRLFFFMDVLACLVWVAILSIILPGSFIASSDDSWRFATLLSLVYGIVAFIRLQHAAGTLALLSSESNIDQTVI